MNTRATLPDRRQGMTVKVTHLHSHGDREYEVTYGFDARGVIREVFCWPTKTGADLHALLSDACIGISHALQRGGRIQDFANSFGQLRPEGAKTEDRHAASSPLGTIARVGVEIEALFARDRATREAVLATLEHSKERISAEVVHGGVE